MSAFQTVVTLLKKKFCNNPLVLVLKHEVSTFTVLRSFILKMFLESGCENFVLENRPNLNVSKNVEEFFSRSTTVLKI